MGNAVRRGNGDPVQIGRGVAGSGGVKTALGATVGTAGLNGVGDATGAGNGVVTIKRCPAGSYRAGTPRPRRTSPAVT